MRQLSTIEFDDVPRSEWHLYNPPDERVLASHQAKLDKKLKWLQDLSDTRFSHWPDKPEQNPNMKNRKKGKQELSAEMKAIRNRKKREKNKRKRMVARARIGKGGVDGYKSN